MRKSAIVSLLVIGLLVFTVAPAFAHRVRGGVFIGVGPYWGPYPYWYYPPPYYYYPPPTVVVEQPPVYVQQPTPPPPPAEPSYWYYCQSAKGYYPNVQSCPEPWTKVPARPQ
ncbi:MAG TPA: hypothetical protein VFO18_00385 [Methylomirabilota bacterium]|nr:hypothetical protein [Methylomirabilota bacterium]